MALLLAFVLALSVVHGAWSYVLVLGAVAYEVGQTWLGWRWSRRQRIHVGAEALVGRVVEVDDDGWARLDGERWRVAGAGPRERARVVAVDGLTLRVEPLA